MWKETDFHSFHSPTPAHSPVQLSRTAWPLIPTATFQSYPGHPGDYWTHVGWCIDVSLGGYYICGL